MPTPVGHALAGIAAGWSIAPPPANRRALVIETVILAAAAAAPDLDLLIGRHSAETHSLGAACIAAALAAAFGWPVGRTRARTFLAVFAAWATHPLLDAMAPDTSPPIGVMAFWPVSHSYFITGLSVFMPIWRSLRGWHEIAHDLLALAREIAILGPVVALVWWWRVGRLRKRFHHEEVSEDHEGV